MYRLSPLIAGPENRNNVLNRRRAWIIAVEGRRDVAKPWKFYNNIFECMSRYGGSDGRRDGDACAETR